MKVSQLFSLKQPRNYVIFSFWYFIWLKIIATSIHFPFYFRGVLAIKWCIRKWSCDFDTLVCSIDGCLVVQWYKQLSQKLIPWAFNSDGLLSSLIGAGSQCNKTIGFIIGLLWPRLILKERNSSAVKNLLNTNSHKDIYFIK